MSVSKVIFGTETLIDITDTTAIAEDVAEGKTFLSASGVLTTGTNQGGGGTPEAHTITIDSLSKSNVGSVSTLPYGFGYDAGCSVVYNNEIHILGGGTNTTTKTNHYKWNGSTWTSVSTLPYNLRNGCAVVYNNEIHIIGSYDDVTKHYKWNGEEWTSVSTLPYNFKYGRAVVYNNEIHILGGSTSGTEKNHYKWDGDSWVSVSTLPYNFYSGCAVVYNNEIHIMGTSNAASTTRLYHYKWNGTSWSSVSTLPYSFYGGSAVVYNNKIHILGSVITDYRIFHYKLDGTSWTSVSTLPYEFYSGSAVVYNNEIHILGGGDTNATMKNHYALQITTPTSITSNGIYNIVGSKTETALDKLISNLTAKTAGSISVDIDMSATATADKIMQGYTAWANGVKLTGTSTGGGGGGYTATGKASSTSSLTFSNLSIPYSNINNYLIVCRSLNASSSSYRWIYYVTNTSGSLESKSLRYTRTLGETLFDSSSYMSVSGSGNSITFTSSSANYARFVTTSNAYTIMYC